MVFGVPRRSYSYRSSLWRETALSDAHLGGRRSLHLPHPNFPSPWKGSSKIRWRLLSSSSSFSYKCCCSKYSMSETSLIVSSQWLWKKHKNSLLEALEKIKAGKVNIYSLDCLKSFFIWFLKWWLILQSWWSLDSFLYYSLLEKHIFSRSVFLERLLSLCYLVHLKTQSFSRNLLHLLADIFWLLVIYLWIANKDLSHL